MKKNESMRRGKGILTLLIGVALMGRSVTVNAIESPNTGLTPQEQEKNMSLATYGVNSPYYDNSYLIPCYCGVRFAEGQDHYLDCKGDIGIDPVPGPTPTLFTDWSRENETGEWTLVPNQYLNWIDFSQYSSTADPKWGMMLLNNYQNTAYAEAPASTGVQNYLQTEIGYDVGLDGTNAVVYSLDYHDLGITDEEVTALPVLPVTDSWKNVGRVFEGEQFAQYADTVSDLLWAHKGEYTGMRPEKLGDALLINAVSGNPVGLVWSQGEHAYARNGRGPVYGKLEPGAFVNVVDKAKVTMKYPIWGQYGETTFELLALPMNIAWSSQQWRLCINTVPNELDWKVIQSLLHQISPDGEIIYQALRVEGSDPQGYGPWKYWDKWYDIGEQSRIRTWRILKTQDYAKLSADGSGGSKYYYDIAPRDNGATVEMPALQVFYDYHYEIADKLGYR